MFEESDWTIIQNNTKSTCYCRNQNFKRLTKAPFRIFDEFECVLISSTNIDFGSNTKKYEDHIVCSYDYKLICVYERYSKPYKTYFGENAMESLK